MKYELYEIQQRIVDENKPMTGIFLGTGVGKTLPTLLLAEGMTLVVCPKQQKLDRTWEKNNEKFGLGKNLTVVSKEEFRRDWTEIGYFDTVIFDEGHNILGVLPETRQRNRVTIPKTSQLFEAALRYVGEHEPKRFYIVTATPMSKPMNVWAIARLFGKTWDFFKFRSTFYFPAMMGRRQIWLPRKDESTRQRLALAVQKLGYTGALQDFMDVPEQTHIEVDVELTDEQKVALKKLDLEEADPLVRRARMRTIENGVLYGKKVEEISEKEHAMVRDTQLFKNGKLDYILARCDEFNKVFVFAAYTAQVDMIADEVEMMLDDDWEVFKVKGDTKNRGEIFDLAEKAKKCLVVCAAQICEGYRVPSAPCMIFASKSNRYTHFQQGVGRILDGQHLKKNLYIHLVVRGGADEACHKAIQDGRDFEEKLSML